MLVECSNCGMYSLSSNNVCAFCGADIKKDSFRDKLKHDVSLIALGLWTFTILNYFFHNIYISNIVQGLDLAFAVTIGVTLILDPLLKKRQIRKFIKKRYLEIIYASPILRPLLPASRNMKLLSVMAHKHHFLHSNAELLRESKSLKYYIKHNKVIRRKSREGIYSLKKQLYKTKEPISRKILNLFYNPNRKVVRMYV